MWTLPSITADFFPIWTRFFLAHYIRAPGSCSVCRKKRKKKWGHLQPYIRNWNLNQVWHFPLICRIKTAHVTHVCNDNCGIRIILLYNKYCWTLGPHHIILMGMHIKTISPSCGLRLVSKHKTFFCNFLGCLYSIYPLLKLHRSKRYSRLSKNKIKSIPAFHSTNQSTTV